MITATDTLTFVARHRLDKKQLARIYDWFEAEVQDAFDVRRGHEPKGWQKNRAEDAIGIAQSAISGLWNRNKPPGLGTLLALGEWARKRGRPVSFDFLLAGTSPSTETLDAIRDLLGGDRGTAAAPPTSSRTGERLRVR